MKFILFILFISYPAFAMFAQSMGPQMGMDPICLIALQAGMSGSSNNSQPMSLEGQIADIEDRLEQLEEEIDEDRKAILDSDIFKTFKCKNESGDDCTDPIRDSTIMRDIISHIEKNKMVPSECASVVSSGVSFYFEEFLPHLRYASLPLALVVPSRAMAIDAASTGEGTTGGTRPDPVASCTDPAKPKWNGDKCVCEGGSCGDGKVCNNVGECEEESARDPAAACTDPAKPKWNGDKCVCEGSSCGDGKVCNNVGECEEESARDPAASCTDPAKPKWNGDKCMCEGGSCGDGKVCNNGECKTPPPVVVPAPFDWCENCECRYKKYFEDDGNIDIDGLCEDPLLLPIDADGNVEETARDDCKDYLQYIVENIKEINALKKELGRLKKKQEKKEREARRFARKCERNPELEICQQKAPGATEAGTFCTKCFQEVIDASYPKRSAWDKFLNAVIPLAGTGLAYYGIKETNKLRSRQGFPVDNSAMYGLAYPFIAQMLYGGALGGRGRNALACSPSAHTNAYSGMFNAYGQFGVIPGVISGINGGFLQGGIPIPGYAGGGIYGGGLPGGYAGGGIYGGGLPGGYAGGGIYGGGLPGGYAGGVGNSYHAQLQMRQQMQSYYLQLQQFQMERQRIKQSVVMRYQQEAQSLALKYQTYLSNMSYSGGSSYPPPSFPGGSGGSPYIPYTDPGGSPSGGDNPYR